MNGDNMSTGVTLILSVDSNDHAVDFVAAGTKIGDEVKMSGAPSNMFSGGNAPDPNTFAGKFLITEVVGPTTIKYDGYLPNSSVPMNLTLNDSATGTIDYEIVHNLSKDEQVAEIVAIAQGLASKRAVLVWPPVALMQDGTQVDGTFIAACLASAKSANPAQQGFTNFPIPGPYKLQYSNTYFTKSQIKTLTDAGVMVFMQDAPGANMYAARQVTTDTSSFVNMELSCVTAVDKASADLVATFKPFIGPYNISQDFISFLHQLADNYFFKAINTKAPKCGGLLLDGSVTSILANIEGSNPEIPDGMTQIIADVAVGKPNNWTTINLMIH
jgi:hypothetical protein